MTGTYQPTERTGGQALVEQLIEEGVTDIFGVPGIQLDWAVEAIRQNANAIRYVMPRHEQAASYMADGYARTTGKEGVFMVVPGPGILNALAGLATAYACNSRVLCIAGQIPSNLIGGGYGMLHEIPDQSGILKSLSKWHALARRPEEIPALVHEAFVQLRSGTPKPVVIEVPPDVLQAKGIATLLAHAGFERLTAEPNSIEAAAQTLSAARFPVIYAGGGALASWAGEAVLALAQKLQAPIVMSENCRGLVDDEHPLALSPVGARAILPHADAVLVLGSRFVDGHAQPTYASATAQFIYVNTDRAAAAAPRSPGLLVQADVKQACDDILGVLPAQARPSGEDKARKVKAWIDGQLDAIRPQRDYVDALRNSLGRDEILVSELTQVGYFANIAYPVAQAGTFVNPGYQGTLGYGFNTALGAAYGNPGKRVVSINGDGGFGWGMQELATLARDRLDLSVVVFVDGHYGNVKRIQKRVFGDTFAVQLANPQFEALAAAFNLPFHAADSADALEAALAAARAEGGPALIAVTVGEMPSPWHLIHRFSPPPAPPPPNPLGEPN